MPDLASPRALLLCLLMSLAHAACTAHLPVSTIGQHVACHGSVEEAARAGLLAAAARSRKLEYGGAVFLRTNGCFAYSEPVTSRQRAQLEFVARPERGAILVGIYHTHATRSRGHVQ